MNQHIPSYYDNQDIDFKRILQLILSNWLLIVVLSVIALSIAYLYNRYTQSVYRAAGTIIVKDESSNSLGSDAVQLQGLDLFKIKKNLSTEIEIIKSKSVIEKAVNAMDFDLQVSYYAKGRFKTTELYKDTPFLIKIDTLYSPAYGRTFKVSFIDETKFTLSYQEGEDEISHTYLINEPVRSQFGIFRIQNQTASLGKSEHDNGYAFVIHHPNSLVGQYRGKVSVFRASEETSILVIACEDEVPQRAKDFVNTLINIYSDRGVAEKNKVADNTISFIDKQLQLIKDSLSLSERDIENFKVETGIINLTPDFAVQRFTDFDGRKQEIELQLKSLDSLAKHIKQGKDISLVSPSNLGAQDPMLSNTLSELNKLEIQKNNKLLNLSSVHPDIRALNRQLDILREELLKNIDITKDALQQNLKTLKTALTKYERSLAKIPTTQREFLGIERNYSINEKIFTLLLTEKYRNNIAKSANAKDNVVLDYAETPGKPIRPKHSQAYIIAIFVSLTLSLSYIFIRDFLDDTVSDRMQVERLTSISVLGTVSHARNNYTNDLIVLQSPKSAVAESFRSIRTNLQYLASEVANKIVVVTSTISGEGKTFFALNIASILAVSNKKVLLIGLDLRKPKIHYELDIPTEVGISKILIGKATAEEVTFKTPVENLYVMPAGPIPPNPSELIMSEKMQKLLHELRPKYDYIIIDTPPVGLVTDALIAMKYADINVYILRQKTSKKNYLDTVNKLQEDPTIKNLAIVLNDLRLNKGYSNYNGYGGYGGYGYGYYEEETKGNDLFDNISETIKDLFSKKKS